MIDYKNLALDVFSAISENVEDSAPATEYVSGDQNNATFLDLNELVGAVEEDHYGEVADIISQFTTLAYMGGEVGTIQFGDLLELLKLVDKDDYNDLADDLLEFIDETYGDLEEGYGNDDLKNDEDDEDDEDEKGKDDKDSDKVGDEDKDLPNSKLKESFEIYLNEDYYYNEYILENRAKIDGYIVEGFLKRFASRVKNRTFFKKSASKLRVGKLKNKSKNRIKRIANVVKRKIKRFATKKYNTSRNLAIKTGRHIAKLHRGLKSKFKRK